MYGLSPQEMGVVHVCLLLMALTSHLLFSIAFFLIILILKLSMATDAHMISTCYTHPIKIQHFSVHSKFKYCAIFNIRSNVSQFWIENLLLTAVSHVSKMILT